MALNTNQQILELVNKSHNILIVTSITDTGDGLSSALTLKLIFEKLNKPADIIVPESNKNKFNFLPSANKIKTSLSSLKKLIINIDIKNNKIADFNYDISNDQLKIFITPEKGDLKPEAVSTTPSDFKYDLIITLGAPDLESLGSLYENNPSFFYNISIINIDNSAANEHYGQINLIELNSSSYAEIIYNLIQAFNPEFIDEAIATNLLTGIIIKTNSFRTSYINPNCLLIASQLIKLGADRQFIINSLNKNKNLPTLNLWGRVLARLKQDTHYKLAWSLLSQTDFQKSGTNTDSLDGVVDELITNSPQIEITLLLFETNTGQIAGKLYTSPNYDSLHLCRSFNPQGDSHEAFFTLNSTRLIEVEQQVINQIRERIKKQ